MPKRSREQPVYTLLPPHYHNRWVFKDLRRELRQLGREAIAPWLDISNPSKTRDDHAAAIRAAEEKKGAEAYDRVGFSWSGDIIYRQIGGHVSKLILGAAPLRQYLRQCGLTEVLPELENEATLSYRAAVRGLETGAAGFDRHGLAEVIYQDIEDPALKDK